MPLAPGTRLGPYEVTAPLGAGGMGEVYRGTDTRLDRAVAIKILPAHHSGDAALRERFEREARAVSALNHPNICTLYDVGHQDGVDFLVMELVEGETLADRLARGPLPLDRAIAHAIEIAGALDKAHRQGIVHRDLKPGNVMLTKAGAKLLDFGLAKVTPQAPVGAMSMMPTTPANLTAHGAVLGTFQYMAPEQLEGQDADARSDLFSFGAVLYEMVTGRRAFEARSQAALISAILTVAPTPLRTLTPQAPPSLDYVVSRCLQKDPDDRWQTARDLLAELRRGDAPPNDASSAAASLPPAAPAPSRRSRERLAWATAAVATLFALGGVTWLVAARPTAVPPRPLAVSVSLAPVTLYGGFSLSPDGSRLAFVGSTPGGASRIYLRQLDRSPAVPLAGTELTALTGAPAFSPDSKWIAFVAEGTLKKIAIAGGRPDVLSEAMATGDVAWVSQTDLVYSTDTGLFKVSAAGGKPVALTTEDRGAGVNAHTRPLAVPGTAVIVYCVERDDGTQVVAQALDSGATKVVTDGIPLAAHRGHLLVWRANENIVAVPFDATNLAASGDPVTVMSGIGSLSVADDGTAAFLAGTADASAINDRTLVLVDRQGVARPIPLPSRAYSDPRIAPSGDRVAVHLFETGRENWVGDLERGTLTRLTFDPGEDETPLWSPDGRTVVYTGTRGPRRYIFRRNADGTGDEQQVWSGEGHVHLGGFTPDGRTLITSIRRGGPLQIMTVSLADGTSSILAESRFARYNPALSPDGRWIAYTSDESGRPEVFVQPFPSMDARWQISADGGNQAVWSPTGRELFYRGGGKMMAVEIATTGGFSASPPRPLFADQFADTQGLTHRNYDITPDGQHFLMVTLGRQSTQPVTHVDLWVDWFATVMRQRATP